MNESTDQCAICSQQPEDMLILSCSHNLCLSCATELYSASSNQHLLQCQICLANTPLDTDTISCLAALAVPQPAPPIAETKIPKPPKTTKSMQCLQHGEQALYFCFDCQNSSICSECILESGHSGHTIVTLKKAVRLLVDKIGDHSRHLEEVRDRVKDKINELSGLRASLVVEYQSRQNDLKSLFEGIIGLVTEKYNQLGVQLQTQQRRSFQIIEGTVNKLTKQMEQISKQINENKDLTQKPQQNLIVRRYLELETTVQQYENDNTPNLEHLTQIFSLTSEATCQPEIEETLRKVNWAKDSFQMKENQHAHLNSIELEGSFLGRSPEAENKCYPASEHIEIVDNCLRDDSMSKYSGIKGSSRRLELSRSMNNATNIISRLQERVRK